MATVKAPMACREDDEESSSTLPSQQVQPPKPRHVESMTEIPPFNDAQHEAPKPRKDDALSSTMERSSEVSDSSPQTENDRDAESRYTTRSFKKSVSKQPGSLRLSNHAVSLLRGWVFSPEHIDYPYPSKAEKEELAREAGITIQQLNNFMANVRKRSWGPFWKRRKGSNETGERPSEIERAPIRSDVQTGKRSRSFPAADYTEESISQTDGALMLSRLKRVKETPVDARNYVSGPSRPLQVPTISNFHNSSQYQPGAYRHPYPSACVSSAYSAHLSNEGYPVSPYASTAAGPWRGYWPPTSAALAWQHQHPPTATASYATSGYPGMYSSPAQNVSSPAFHHYAQPVHPSYEAPSTSTFPPGTTTRAGVYAYQHYPPIPSSMPRR